MKRENQSETGTILRQKAEALIIRKTSQKSPHLSEFEAMRLVHELEVHQIELELQNEELFLAKEKAAELATEKYTELYDFAPSAYFTLSRTGDILDLNLCGAQMLGKERSLLKKRRFSFFISDDTKPFFNNFLGTVFNSNMRETCELTICADGNKPIDVHLVGIASDNGEQCLVTLDDITERKQAERAMKESEEKYHFLFDNNPQPMFIFDLETLAFLEVNNPAIKHYGYTRAEFLSMKLTDIRPDEDIEAMLKDIELNKQAYNPAGEWRHIKKNGELIFVEITSYSMVFNGRNARNVLVHDVTARKMAEEVIKCKNEELQKINAEKDKFFSIIAHDLRSPFNGFLGLTEILAEGLPQMTLDEIQQIAVAMRNSAANLFHLLGNLLEWSRMQRGLTTFLPISVSLMSKIKENMVLTHEAANKKGITINYNVPADLEVFADSDMLGSIIRNLMTNAVKFTSSGGSIFVSAKAVSDNLVHILIKDTGIGMKQTLIGNLFHLDVDTNRKGTEGESSTGLGLMICKDFIEKNGGQLWIESEEGKGSTFSFSLPARR